MSQDTAAFQSRSSRSGDVITVELVGEVTLDATDSLKSVLRTTHDSAQKEPTKEVVVDFTQLDFLNSSGIKHLVTWINSVSQLPEASRYQIRLRSNPLIPWQRRSLATLKYFAPNLLTIEPVGTA